MKKRIFFGVLAVFLILVGICWGAELMNIRVTGEDGNMVFRDQSGNIIMTLDAANRKLTIPSGSNITVSSGGTFTGTGTATLASPVLTTPSITGGTQSSPTITTPTITSPDITFGAMSTQHDYTAHADWTLSTAEAKYVLLITSSGDATSSNIVVYPSPSNGKLYIVRNGSQQNNVIKASGGTGVTIASSKTAAVIFWGSDFIRVSADATH